MSFAPGPWIPIDGESLTIVTSDGRRVARCEFDGDFDKQVVCANGRLIAVAPRLLELLEDAVAELEFAAKFLERARSGRASSIGRGIEAKRIAIAYAKG